MNPPNPCQGNRFSSDTDEDLLFYMSLQGEDPEGAKLAWAEFFQRHSGYVLSVCNKSYGAQLGDMGAADLAKDTLVRAYHRAKAFRPAAGGDAESKRKRIRGWLGRIANRLFLSSWRRRLNVVSIEDLISETGEPEAPNSSDVEVAVDPGRMALLRQALRTLTQREREILVASYAWYDEADGCHKMPSDELAALVAKYQTTAVNIRKIRSRAKEKVEQYIESSPQVEAAGRNDAKPKARFS